MRSQLGSPPPSRAVRRGGGAKARVGALAMVLCGAGAGVSATPPAQAAVPGLVRVTNVSPLDSTAVKSLSVACPPGKKVVGAGAFTTGPAGRVVLDEVMPGPTLLGASAIAAETGSGTAANWTLTVHATCAVPLPGMVRVKADSPVDTTSVKSVIAWCPAGTRVVGSGGQANGEAGAAALDEVTPLPNLAGVVTVVARTPSAQTAHWYATSAAICASALPGQTSRSSTTANTSAGTREATVSCPSGTKVLSAAGQVNGPAGRPTVTSFRPLSDSSSARATAAETLPGTDSVWNLTVYAICATP